MRYPKVKLFGKTYNVVKIEWDKETGEIEHIVYIYPSGEINLIFQFEKIDYGHEIKDLAEPFTQPHYGYVGVPSFESVLEYEL